ncbi:MAG: SigE family RNA polymerase sigma factor [Actinomycetota bacterium]
MWGVYKNLDTMMSTDPARTYDEFYRQELRPLVALAAAITGSHLAAEDIAQEALIRAYKQWDVVSTYEKPGAWTRRVAINLALSTTRRMAADVRARLKLGAQPSLMPAAPQHDPVWAAVRKLPGNQRAAVALHYLEDRPVSEIAELLACSESTAKVHLHRGRTKLATLLEEEGRR